MNARDHVARLEAAVKSSYIEGYIQGAHHPHRTSVMAKAMMLADKWWATIRLTADERRATPAGGTEP